MVSNTVIDFSVSHHITHISFSTHLLQLQKRQFTITKGAVVLNIFVSVTIAIEKLLEGCDSKFATGDEVQLVCALCSILLFVLINTVFILTIHILDQ